MYRIITVAREHGSGGGAIAKRVAERLNWRLLDKNLIAAIARPQHDVDTVSRCDRSVDSWWHLLTRGGRWSAALVVEALPAHPQFFDTGRMAALAKKFIAGVFPISPEISLDVVGASPIGGLNQSSHFRWDIHPMRPQKATALLLAAERRCATRRTRAFHGA